MIASLRDSTTRGDSLLGDHPVNDIRRLEAAETESEIVITGVVSSYYLKQMAQEAVRPALAGRRLQNRVIVVPVHQATEGVPVTDLMAAMTSEDED